MVDGEEAWSVIATNCPAQPLAAIKLFLTLIILRHENVRRVEMNGCFGKMKMWFVGILAVVLVTATYGDAVSSIVLKQYELTGNRQAEARYYRMVTKVVAMEEDGTRQGATVFVLYLKGEPAGANSEDGHRYTCGKLTYKIGDKPVKRISALDNWGYIFKRGEDGSFNQGGKVLGIDNERFAGLKNSEGEIVPLETAYMLYNNFVDFHAFCDVFARDTKKGKGVQDLKKIGQKVVHASAFSEPSVELIGQTGKGSVFRNGEVTLEFKGLGVIDDVPCGLLGYDSGDSSFEMLLEPIPGMKVKAVGASHYWGDIYLELDSKWVRKVEMKELVVSKVTSGDQVLAKSVIERDLSIETLDEGEFNDSTKR
jgi:hypothetical protein